MNVLMSCFALAPSIGSEAAVGWTLASSMARDNEVWAFVDSWWFSYFNQAEIESECPRLHIVEVRVPHGIAWIRGHFGLHYVYYMIWQYRALRTARKLSEAIRFDVVHHVAYQNSWAPSFLGRLGPPFIWSAGGRDRTPWRFVLRGSVSLRGKLSEAARNLVLRLFGPVADRVSARRAATVLTASAVSAWPGSIPTVRMPMGGLSPRDLAALGAIGTRARAPMRIASAGRLLALKGFDLGLRAFAEVLNTNPDAEYWIVGDGPERKMLERIARRLGCIGSVRFLAWRDRAAMTEIWAAIDVLLHPSLHEQLGYVILEAMAAGRPVVCLDVAGPPVVMSDAGILVSVTSPEQVVRDLAAALRKLLDDRDLREHYSALGRRIVRERWSFEGVATRVKELYRNIALAGEGEGRGGKKDSAQSDRT